jgi:UDP-N-acetylglucosamine--N-acetylmuramyl-(pentapeptide) pyrophosphoryl-undecaprenol N-acetylglucosamine transferase
LRGKGIKAILFAPFRLLMATLQAGRILRQLRPDVVLGMGGFVSGPGGIASWLLRRPLIVHEQNAKAGLTNKWLACVAAKVLQGFPDTFPARAKVVTTGNPVRNEITEIAAPERRLQDRSQPLRLLVVGGSLGAHAINTLLPRALARLPVAERPVVRHQTGDKHAEATRAAYEAVGVQADVMPFITDMGTAYGWADIVLCRAGALTVAELCAAGLGAILIPYPYAVDDHQTANANYLVKHEAALLVQQAALTEEGLAEMIQQLSRSPARRMAMAQAAYQLRQVDATTKVLEICGEYCH